MTVVPVAWSLETAFSLTASNVNSSTTYPIAISCPWLGYRTLGYNIAKPTADDLVGEFCHGLRIRSRSNSLTSTAALVPATTPDITAQLTESVHLVDVK